MSGRPAPVRVVDTPKGPGLLIEPGPAAVLAAALGSVLVALPPAAQEAARTLGALRAACIDVKRSAAAFDDESATTQADRNPEQWISAAGAAALLGVTAQAVTDRCRRGRIPGALRIGRSWLIPADSIIPEVGRP